MLHIINPSLQLCSNSLIITCTKSLSLRSLQYKQWLCFVSYLSWSVTVGFVLFCIYPHSFILKTNPRTGSRCSSLVSSGLSSSGSWQVSPNLRFKPQRGSLYAGFGLSVVVYTLLSRCRRCFQSTRCVFITSRTAVSYLSSAMFYSSVHLHTFLWYKVNVQPDAGCPAAVPAGLRGGEGQMTDCLYCSLCFRHVWVYRLPAARPISVQPRPIPA